MSDYRTHDKVISTHATESEAIERLYREKLIRVEGVGIVPVRYAHPPIRTVDPWAVVTKPDRSIK